MDQMLPAGRLYHWCYVVDDLDRAQRELGEIFRLEWAAVMDRRSRTIDRHGTVDNELRVVYSITGPPHIEIIEGKPNSIWDTAGTSRFHHVGLWVEDLEAEAGRLEGLGLPIAGYGVDRGGSRYFTYHENDYGPWIELVGPSVRGPFERWMAGGDFS